MSPASRLVEPTNGLRRISSVIRQNQSDLRMSCANPLLTEVLRSRVVAIFLNDDSVMLRALQAENPAAIAVYRKPGRKPDEIVGTLSLPYAGIGDVGRNNADVLVLDGPSIVSSV